METLSLQLLQLDNNIQDTLNDEKAGPIFRRIETAASNMLEIASYIQTGPGPQRYGEDQDVAGSFSPELGTQVGTLKFSWSDDNGNVQTQYTLNFIRPIIRGQDIFIPGRFARTQMLKGDLVVFQAILDPKRATWRATWVQKNENEWIFANFQLRSVPRKRTSWTKRRRT